VSISTLGISRRLKSNGFTESQAEAVAEEFVEVFEHSELVTKDFLSGKIGELKADSASLETKLIGKIGDVKNDMAGLRCDMAGLRCDMAGLETRMLKWMIGLQLTSLGLMFGLIYFLLRH
jgi:hypothetical protein